MKCNVVVCDDAATAVISFTLETAHVKPTHYEYGYCDTHLPYYRNVFDQVVWYTDIVVSPIYGAE